MTTATAKRRPPVADARKSRKPAAKKKVAKKPDSNGASPNGNTIAEEPSGNTIAEEPSVVSTSLVDKMAGTFLCSDGRRIHPHFGRRMAQIDEDTQEKIYLKLEQLGLKEKVIEFKARVVEKEEDGGYQEIETAGNQAVTESIDANGKLRIYWQEAEWEALAQAAWKLRQEDLTVPLASLLPKAQEIAIAEDRRRFLTTIPKAFIHRLQKLNEEAMGKSAEQYKEDIAGLKREHADAMEMAKLEMEEALAQRPTREKVMEDLSQKELQKLTPRLIQATSLRQFLSFFTPEEVMECYTAAQMLPAVVQVLSASISQFSQQVGVVAAALQGGGFAQPQPVPATPAADAEPILGRKPKVCIVGPRDKDMPGLRDHFKGKCELVFIKKDQRISLDMFPTNCALIVMWTNFVNHGHCGMAKSHGRKNGIPVREWDVGSWRSIAKNIDEFFAMLDAA